MLKNEERKGKVISLGVNGEGVIKENDVAIFLPYALPSEQVEYKILKAKKNIAFAKLIKIESKNPFRVVPVCNVFEKCGGCQLQHLAYSEQLKHKQNVVKDCFKKIAFLEVDVKETVKSDNEYGYRNKLQLPVAETKNGTALGFFAENSHRIIPIKECSIQPQWATRIIEVFNDYVKKHEIKGYNEEKNSGELRHIVVREVDGKFIIVAVSLKETLRGIDYLISSLQKHFDEFSLFINVNKKPTNVILGDKYILVYGEGKYVAESFGIKYEISAQSFMQVNSNVSSKIYKKAVELATLNKDDIVIDAYSGAGLMTAMLSKNCKKAIGIEIIKEATENADSLAKINNLTDKMTNICGKCEEILPPMIEKLSKSGEKTVVVLDPPRKGCDIKVLQAIKQSNTNKIVYISCNPATLARDIGFLVGTLEMQSQELKKVENPNYQYKITYAEPYDMFPQTKHVETVICLERV